MKNPTSSHRGRAHRRHQRALARARDDGQWDTSGVSTSFFGQYGKKLALTAAIPWAFLGLYLMVAASERQAVDEATVAVIGAVGLVWAVVAAAICARQWRALQRALTSEDDTMMPSMDSQLDAPVVFDTTEQTASTDAVHHVRR